jgi:hypothetical protein
LGYGSKTPRNNPQSIDIKQQKKEKSVQLIGKTGAPTRNKHSVNKHAVQRTNTCR